MIILLRIRSKNILRLIKLFLCIYHQWNLYGFKNYLKSYLRSSVSHCMFQMGAKFNTVMHLATLLLAAKVFSYNITEVNHESCSIKIFYRKIVFRDEAHFRINGYVKKLNCQNLEWRAASLKLWRNYQCIPQNENFGMDYGPCDDYKNYFPEME